MCREWGYRKVPTRQHGWRGSRHLQRLGVTLSTLKAATRLYSRAAEKGYLLGNWSYGVKSSRKFAKGSALLLQYRFDWLVRSYRVCMPMHELPSTVFGSKDQRNPQI